MMKKLTGWLLLGCLGLTVSGCKGDTDDVSKQLTKMSNVIEEDDIFDEDYSMKVKIEIPSQNKGNSLMEYTFKMDDDKVYLDLTTTYRNETSSIKVWIEEEDDVYYTYIDNGKSKVYSEYSSENDAFKAFDNLGVSINSSLKETYNNLYSELEKLTNDCENEENDTITCSVERTLFGKVTLNTRLESILGSVIESTYTLKKGKLIRAATKASHDEYESSTVIEFDYSNQKITIPNKKDYTNQ